MSMKPGATINPLASMTRVASPLRREPKAAMRSPSTATSAATPGAPLPSTTVPPLMRSDQAMNLLGRLDDLDRLHLVALLDIVHDVHARGDLAEHGVLAVEEVGGGEGDVKLAARGVGILAARHGHYAAHVLLLVELGLDLVPGAARAITLGIAALNYKVRLHAVEDQPVVEALLGEGDEVLDGFGRVVGEKLDLDDAALLHGDLGNLFHASGSFLGLSGFGCLRPCAGRRDEGNDECSQEQSGLHVLNPPRGGVGGHYAPPVGFGQGSTHCAMRKIRARVGTWTSAKTFGTSPSSPTSTTARQPSSTPCYGNRASSAPTSMWRSGSWTRSTSSARRASRSWPRTRPFITRT